MTFRWGRRLDNLHDERGPLHALKDDNSPLCGASYFAMGGALQDPQGPRCSNCQRILEARKRRALQGLRKSLGPDWNDHPR